MRFIFAFFLLFALVSPSMALREWFSRGDLMSVVRAYQRSTELVSIFSVALHHLTDDFSQVNSLQARGVNTCINAGVKLEIPFNEYIPIRNPPRILLVCLRPPRCNPKTLKSWGFMSSQACVRKGGKYYLCRRKEKEADMCISTKNRAMKTYQLDGGECYAS